MNHVAPIEFYVFLRDICDFGKQIINSRTYSIIFINVELISEYDFFQICVNGAPAGISRGQSLTNNLNEVKQEVSVSLRGDNSEFQLDSRAIGGPSFDSNPHGDERRKELEAT